MRVLIVSNLDSRNPFGQSVRPYFLGRGLAEHGVEVGNAGVDTSQADYGPGWSTGERSLARLARATAKATREFRPDVIYAHEMRSGMAALAGARGVPLVVDFHSLPSVEWAGYARNASGLRALGYRAAGARTFTAERLTARRADALIAAGEAVARGLEERHSPRVKPVVVVNGVDAHLLDTPSAGASPYEGNGRHAVATLPSSSPSNLRALRFLAESARELEPGLTVHVLGSDDGPPAPALRYLGYQPDLLPWIEHADACLLPYPEDATLAGGAKQKLVEYLARGRAIVTTPEGLRGLEEVGSWNGVTLAPAEPKAFADALTAATGEGASTLDPDRTAVRERLRWDVLAGQVRDVLASVAR